MLFIRFSACLEVVPEVYSGKLFSPGKTGVLEPHFGYFFVLSAPTGSAKNKLSVSGEVFCHQARHENREYRGK